MGLAKNVCILLCFITAAFSPCASATDAYAYLANATPTRAKNANRSFLIDYEGNRFLKDGRPYQYFSGSIHYFRVPEAYWEDRLAKVKAAGLNAIEFYVPWNLHEPNLGEYDFSSESTNVTKFMKIAQRHGLDVILRMGPYSCGEYENGGLPWWLLKISDIRMRTSDTRYLFYVTKWYFKLFPMIVPLLYKNGGPIIMLQVENEYGSFYACDRDYMAFLRDLFRSYVGDDVVLFTVDGGAMSYLKCGYTPGLYPTVDFGVADKSAIATSFAAQRSYAARGPLVNTEFYPGWLDIWGIQHQTVGTQGILQSMKDMWQMGASINFYMFHGGTTFGYMSGSVGAQPCTTSYDYDAPLSEAGDPTPKYLQIRGMIQNLTGVQIAEPVPPATPKKAYGNIAVDLIGSIFDLLHIWEGKKVQSKYPLSFEQLDFPYGFILYETNLTVSTSDSGSNLSVLGLRDRGYVMVDGTPRGVLVHMLKKYVLPLSAKQGQKLQILVENNGRHTAGTNDPKGIVGNVTLEDRTLADWTMYPITVEDLFAPIKGDKPRSGLKRLVKLSARKMRAASKSFVPSVYFAKFSLDQPDADTFWHPGNWSKGQFFLNEFNVGRYWPSLGPQVTLYVPKHLLNSTNYALVFELEQPGNCRGGMLEQCAFSFVDQPILDEKIPTTGINGTEKNLLDSRPEILVV